MNAEIIQICDIAIAAKIALKTGEKIKYAPLEYENKTEFIFETGVKAKNIYEWYKFCVKKGLWDIKMLVPVYVKDRSLLGFSNADQRCLLCIFQDGKASYFIPVWQYKKGLKSGWEITYTEFCKEKGADKFDFHDNTKEFKSVLSKIAKFAEKIECQNFADIFMRALNTLENGKIDPYFEKYFSLLPEKNARLFCAAYLCDVFGAMGSWNDDPHGDAAEKGLEEEYDELSDELLKQNRLALLYGVNGW